MKAADEFAALIKAGKATEDRKMVENEMKRIEFAPDTITQRKGNAAVFTRKGKRVEMGAKGVWQLKTKT